MLPSLCCQACASAGCRCRCRCREVLSDKGCHKIHQVLSTGAVRETLSWDAVMGCCPGAGARLSGGAVRGTGRDVRRVQAHAWLAQWASHAAPAAIAVLLHVHGLHTFLAAAAFLSASSPGRRRCAAAASSSAACASCCSAAERADSSVTLRAGTKGSWAIAAGAVTGHVICRLDGCMITR